MKPFILFLFVSILLFSSCKDHQNASDSKEKTTSTFYFIRHAEKDRSDSSNQNPHLNEEGLLRAKKWSEVLKNISFDAIYSTDYNRTRETALPTALSNNLQTIIYDPNMMDITKFLSDNIGKNVLVVGHSNTTPKLVNNILKSETYKEIDDSNNANLYIVTINSNEITSTLLFIK
ncbi:Histidine phosphatase superfamily (branch 1) [Flaviramulus basaltis]|uniref:Histidine phosphatase superfamily (Branch 1) n=1 Tax=Flaviramulus basaltis TaxID=369401 RepID=A0A1K2IQ13_9FLAO|nr:phosphoglycerate mutase family protein [Flaviramulus basaltis]SFZ94398.1 Histidine phosphatase superfamily (branch 1) [Flaviramulus basaltis]